jgi:ceramide glucosyltransferase
MFFYLLVYWVFAVTSAVGTLGCLGAMAMLVARFRRPAQAGAEGPPAALALIVPIKGADAHTEGNLSALVASRVPGAVEYLFAMESADDPAYAVCQRVVEQDPNRRSRVVLTGPANGRMGKQHNLAVAARQTSSAVIGSMDADVQVEPDLLAAMLRQVQEPGAGVAYALPCYWGDGPAGGALVALYTNYSFAPNFAALALRGNQPFIIGSLWLVARATLEQIGGLEQFGATVSDDAAIGQAIAQHGLRNVLVPRTVRIPFEPLPLAGGAKHLQKWLAMLRAEGLGAYFTILLLWHPLFWAALALLAAIPIRRGYPSLLDIAAGLAVVALAARVGSAWLLDRLVYRRTNSWLPLWLIPYELVVVPVLFGAGFFRRTIEWRGRRYRLGPHGKIEHAADVTP